MFELTNVEVQTVSIGAGVLFDDVALRSGCAERHRQGSGQITLIKPGIYLISFNADIAIPTGGAVGEISVALRADGEELAGSEMTVTPAAVEEFFNVSTSHLIRVCSPCCVTIGVGNTSTQPILVQNANILAERKS